jgi:sulfatase modifying factor 1
MVRIAGGDFSFGSGAGHADERPEISASIGEFWIDRTEVTVAQFADFVKATGYVTEAERQGGGAVFRIPHAED